MCYFSTHQSIYLSCLSTYLPACLSTCLPACLPPCLSIYLSICLPTFLPPCLPTCLPARLSAYLPVYLPACLAACLPFRPVHSICLFDLFIRSAYSTCLFNPPIQPTSYNKYSRRCYFSTYQSSIYPAFLSNLSTLPSYPICLSNLPINLPTNLPTRSARPIC